MFVFYKTGDILTKEAEALVNTESCVGVMGRGPSSRRRATDEGRAGRTTNIRHVLHAIEGHLVSGYARGGVFAGGEHKRMFTGPRIRLAIDLLRGRGWVAAPQNRA